MTFQYPFYQVDAFTDRPFHGNPAAVVPLKTWLPDHVLLKMAKEHNQSETAFFVPIGDGRHDFELRWFTPSAEIDLCGHATLASAYVIYNQLGFKGDTIAFRTTKGMGDLSVRKAGNLLELDFPVRLLEPRDAPADLIKALNAPVAPREILHNTREWFFVFDDEAVITHLKPDFNVLAKRNDWQCVTAPGTQSDFSSRFFTANDGINEDPVTGSTHCSLAPYWAMRLGKTDMVAHQLSERGGVLKIRQDGNRVKIAGQAVLYSEGKIHLQL